PSRSQARNRSGWRAKVGKMLWSPSRCETPPGTASRRRFRSGSAPHSSGGTGGMRNSSLTASPPPIAPRARGDLNECRARGHRPARSVTQRRRGEVDGLASQPVSSRAVNRPLEEQLAARDPSALSQEELEAVELTERPLWEQGPPHEIFRELRAR